MRSMNTLNGMHFFNYVRKVILELLFLSSFYKQTILSHLLLSILACCLLPSLFAVVLIVGRSGTAPCLIA